MDPLSEKINVALDQVQALNLVDEYTAMKSKEHERPSKVQYYLDIAEVVSSRSTCLRKHYGAVIVKNDEIISCGYNGGPRGGINCTDVGRCFRLENKIPSGEHYEWCHSVHAEANALISASRSETIEATMYLVGKDIENQGFYLINTYPCLMCERMIRNAEIKEIIVRVDAYGEYKRYVQCTPYEIDGPNGIKLMRYYRQ